LPAWSVLSLPINTARLLTFRIQLPTALAVHLLVGLGSMQVQASARRNCPMSSTDATPDISYAPDRPGSVVLQQSGSHGLSPPIKNTFIHFDVLNEDLGMDSIDSRGMFSMPVDVAARGHKQEDAGSPSHESSLSDELISRWLPSLTSSSGSSRSGRRSSSEGAAGGRSTSKANSAKRLNAVAVAEENKEEPPHDTPNLGIANPTSTDMQKHNESLCKPCVFWSKNACAKGATCRNCHLPHQEKGPRRLRRSKQARQRMRNRQSRGIQEEGDDAPRQLIMSL